MSTNDSLETYILKLIKRREDELKELISQKDETYNFGGTQCKIYTEKDYWNKFHRISGQISDLYMCLTAHDNKYEEMQKKQGVS